MRAGRSSTSSSTSPAESLCGRAILLRRGEPAPHRNDPVTGLVEHPRMSQPSRRASTRVAVTARVFAWTGLIAAVVGGGAAIGWRIADPAPIVQNTFGFADASLVGFVALGITFAAVGALLTIRLPTNAVGWCMVVIGVCYALAALTAATTFSAIAAG